MKFALLALLLVVFVVSAIAHVPAQFIIEKLPRSAQLSLGRSDGTLWNGAVHDVRWNNIKLGKLSWELNSLKLLIGKLELDVKLASDNQLQAQGAVGIGFLGKYLIDFNGKIPSTLIDSLARYPFPITSSGLITAQIPYYRFSNLWCDELSGNLRWTDANIQSPLGALNVDTAIAKLSCDNKSLKMNLSNNSDAVQTDIDFSFAPSGRYKIFGKLKPGSAMPADLKRQLGWLGRPNISGQYLINFNG
ncbi:MAG: type II secretion system protein N [Vibrionaceae bacterium]